MPDNYTRTEDELDQDELDINNNSEPATSHDVVEGGSIGLVGGAIVGALAGGPLGAVVGAIAGGAASAAAVSVVDKHDHDYARTVANDNLNDGIVDDRSAYATGMANDPTIPVGYPAAYDDALDADYRNHYQTVYGSAIGAYDEFQPAYRYGYDLANDPRYLNSDWDTVAARAQYDWELQHEGTWDRFKDSIRYAWDKVRGRHNAHNVGVYDRDMNV